MKLLKQQQLDNDQIYTLDYEFDKNRLMDMFHELEPTKIYWPWHINEPSPWSKRGWSVRTVKAVYDGRAPRDSIHRYAYEILQHFGMGMVSFGFFHTKEHFEYPVHTDQGGRLKDNGPLASINVNLLDNPVPIKFTKELQDEPYSKSDDDHSYLYDSALINTSWPHYITTDDNERIVFRMAIFKPFDFYFAKDRIKSLGY